MKRAQIALVPVALVWSLSACGGYKSTSKTAFDAEQPEPDKIERAAYVCASGQNIATDYNRQNGTLALAIGDALLRLREVDATEGTKFSNGQVTFWDKGDYATLEIDGVITECRRELSGSAVPAPARGA